MGIKITDSCVLLPEKKGERWKIPSIMKSCDAKALIWSLGTLEKPPSSNVRKAVQTNMPLTPRRWERVLPHHHLWHRELRLTEARRGRRILTKVTISIATLSKRELQTQQPRLLVHISCGSSGAPQRPVAECGLIRNERKAFAKLFKAVPQPRLPTQFQAQFHCCSKSNTHTKSLQVPRKQSCLPLWPSSSASAIILRRSPRTHRRRAGP